MQSATLSLEKTAAFAMPISTSRRIVCGTTRSRRWKPISVCNRKSRMKMWSMGAEHYRRAVVCFRHGDGAYRSRGVLHRFGLVRHRGEPADAPAGSAQLRLEEPGRDQRVAHGKEDGRRAYAR